MQHEHALLKDSTGVFHIAQRCVHTSSIKPSLIHAEHYASPSRLDDQAMVIRDFLKL